MHNFSAVERAWDSLTPETMGLYVHGLPRREREPKEPVSVAGHRWNEHECVRCHLPRSISNSVKPCVEVLHEA